MVEGGISGNVGGTVRETGGSYRKFAPAGGYGRNRLAARRRRATGTLAALLAPLASGLVGCVSFVPFAEVRSRLPADEFLAVGGHEIHVVSRGGGDPLLLVHGFGGSTLSWEPVIEGLAARRRVVALDLHGFGWSERPTAPEAYTVAAQAELVLGVAERLGFSRFDLAGHSYGGGISLYLAARHPERVRSLVLVDSTLPAYGQLRRRALYGNRKLTGWLARSWGLRRGRVRRGLRDAFHDDSKVTPELVSGYLERLRVEGAEDAFFGLLAPNEEPPAPADLAAIATPTLVVWGAEDELIDVAEGRRSTAALEASSWIVLPGCGHSPMEECPREFLAVVDPFLDARP